MSTESITKDFFIKDEAALDKLIAVLEAETIVDPNKPKREFTVMEEAKEALKSFSFR